MTAIYRDQLKFLVSFIIGFLSKCYYDGLSFYTKRDNKAFQLRHRTRTSKRDCLVLCGQQMDGRVQNKSPKEKMELMQHKETEQLYNWVTCSYRCSS